MQEYEKYSKSTPEEETMHPRLGQAYVPYQKYENIYEPGKALTAGTVFAGLDFPMGGKTR
jgi:hypothetical protein